MDYQWQPHTRYGDRTHDHTVKSRALYLTELTGLYSISIYLRPITILHLKRRLAPDVGIEPTTTRLKAVRST
jgi:hypothetical protein